jgi:GT2 family glycosyltransferase
VAASTTIIIPTRGRPDYLAVTLASIVTQARAAAAEVLVVDDGRDARNEQAARAVDVRYLALGSPRGANAARNAGVDAASGELLVFIDDDIEADPRWLAAYLRAAGDLPEVGVFGGPIRARLEGSRWRTCGRESPPITHTDHGLDDRDVSRAWSANLAIRRATLDAVGRFDERYAESGEEEEWEERYLAMGGRIRYVAAAAVDHRRSAADSTLLRLARVALRRGYASRRYDETKGTAPSVQAELRTLAGCIWHGFRRRCWNGPLLTAHSSGRLLAAFVPVRPGAPAIPAMTSSRARAARSAVGATRCACSRTGRSTCSRCPPASPWRARRGASRRAATCSRSQSSARSIAGAMTRRSPSSAAAATR